MKDSTKNWLAGSLDDFKSAEALHAVGQGRGAIFHIHLAIEQMLKAVICEETGQPPRGHLLVSLASKISREIPEGMVRLINELNDVSVVSRYPDDVEELKASLTPLEVDAYLRRAGELLQWLQQDGRLKR